MGLQKSIRSKVAAALVLLAGMSAVNSALAACSYQLTPDNRTHGYGATTAKVSIATSSSCHWTVVNTNTWISIIAGASGTDDGEFTYVLAGNPNPGTRVGVIQVGNSSYTVTQTGVTCTYSIAPPTHDKCYGATTGSVQVTTQSPCNWTIVNPTDWIVITSGNSGTGSDKVFYSVLANASMTTRIGTVTIAGQPFTITQAPYPVICPTDKQVECGASWTFDAPTLNGPDVTIQSTSTVTNLGCGQSFTAIRTWVVTDRCGNTATCSQTVSAVDVTPPVVTCSPDKSVDCGAEWAFNLPTATDGCGGNVAITILNTVTNLGCGRSFTATRTWRATDACGNASTCSQTVSSVDATAPVLTCGADKSVECGAAWSFNPPTATDGCDGNVAITILSTVTNQGCGQSFTATRTWRAVDACGNAATCTQTVTSTDTTPPVLTCGADKSVECGAAWSFNPPTATDNCDGNVTVTILNTVTNLGCGQSFTATRTWRAVDACGNAATCSQTVTSTDTMPSVLTCGADKSVECGAAWSFNLPTATDNCDGNVTITILSTVTNLGCGQSFTATRTWRAVDACGNASTCSQTVTSSDTTPPVLTCAADKSVECGAAWSFNPPTATDNCDGNVSITILNTLTNLGCGKTFTATRTWKATDACGNAATCSQTVTSTDTTPPVLTCAADQSVECGAAWSFNPPTATDNCDENVAITILNTVTNLGCGQSFTATRTWKATDACGNAAQCSQTVTSTDTTPPVLTCSPNKSVECGVAWSFNAPTATDNCDGNVGITILNTVTNLGCGQSFTATRTWKATDACGNAALCSQTVTSTDATPPVLTCAPDKTVECGAAWSFNPPTATDGCDGNVTITILNTVTNLGCGQSFTATRTWKATDACGNSALCSQTVSAVDATPPVLTCGADKSVECGAAWSFTPPSATDGCGGAVTITILNTVTNGGCGQSFNATRTWNATDACGNAATCSQTVQVTNSALAVVCPPNRVIPCDQAWTFDAPTVSSACAFTVTEMGTVTNLTCGTTFNATRTWLIADGCATRTCVQIVEVKDEMPPSIMCPPDITVTNMSDVPHCAKTLTEFVMGGGQTRDDCGIVHYRCMDGPFIAGPCGGVIERVHIVFDACFNTNFCVQRITVLGGTDVAISIQAADTNIDVCLGGTLTFCVAATGNGPFFYNWLLDDMNIVGATGPCLTVTNLNPVDVSRYSVQVINQCETITKTLSLPGCGMPQPLMMGIQFVPAGVRLEFRGVADKEYQILRGTELGKPWIYIGTSTTAANGLGHFLDISGKQGEFRMYKLVAPSSP